MNPLDLTGPEFLRFYLVYGVLLLLLARWARSRVLRAQEPLPGGLWTPGTYPREDDAPAIALLRGGPPEAVRTLLSRLLSLGYLEVNGQQVRAVDAPPGAPQLQRMERDVWSALGRGGWLSPEETESRVRQAMAPHLDEMDRRLVDRGLLTSPEQRSRLRQILFAAWLAIFGLGCVKLLVALARGRTNVGFLVLLLIGFTVLVFWLLRLPRRLPAGDRYLKWLQEAYSGLRRPLEIGERDSARDLSLAAGIYGLAAVPALLPLGMAFDPSLDPRRRAESGGGGCGGGSSCSSGGDGGGDGGGSGCGGCGGGGD